MPAAFEAGYDDRNWDEKGEAQQQCEAVRAALAAIGIAGEIGDDPPWADAGELSGYFQGCSWGCVFVVVADENLDRAKALVAKIRGRAPAT